MVCAPVGLLPPVTSNPEVRLLNVIVGFPARLNPKLAPPPAPVPMMPTPEASDTEKFNTPVPASVTVTVPPLPPFKQPPAPVQWSEVRSKVRASARATGAARSAAAHAPAISESLYVLGF